MELTSRDNKLIKLAKKLHNKKDRKEEGLFLVEGEKLVKEVILSKLKIDFVLVNYEKDIDLKFDSSIQVFYVDNIMMSYISTTESPPPCMAIVESINWETQELKNYNLVLVVDELQDPGNFGTIIRTAEATNVDCLFVTKGTVDLFNPKVVRASMGSVFRKPVFYIESLEDILDDLEQAHFQILLTTPHSDKSFYDVDYNKKTAVFIGNEGQGLKKNLLELYKNVKIPMFGEIESLNTSIFYYLQ